MFVHLILFILCLEFVCFCRIVEELLEKMQHDADSGTVNQAGMSGQSGMSGEAGTFGRLNDFSVSLVLFWREKNSE